MALNQDLEMGAASGDHRFVSEYPAVAGSVRHARDAVAELVGRLNVRGELIDDVRLAVSEAATNVVMHAYEQGSEAPTFTVVVVLSRGQMTVLVEDEGCGLESPTKSPGLGAGLRVMRKVAAEARFRERDSGGSSVQLSFRLA
jgi:serine/threonine-protein kinase RsbW